MPWIDVDLKVGVQSFLIWHIVPSGALTMTTELSCEEVFNDYVLALDLLVPEEPS